MKKLLLIGATIALLGAGCASGSSNAPPADKPAARSGAPAATPPASQARDERPRAVFVPCARKDLQLADGTYPYTAADAKADFGGDWTLREPEEGSCQYFISGGSGGLLSFRKLYIWRLTKDGYDGERETLKASNEYVGRELGRYPTAELGEGAFLYESASGAPVLNFLTDYRPFRLYCDSSKPCTDTEMITIAKKIKERVAGKK